MKLNIPAGLPPWVSILARDIERALLALEQPKAPVFLPTFPADALPDPVRWRNGMIIISGSGLFVSNGTAWINVVNGDDF